MGFDKVNKDMTSCFLIAPMHTATIRIAVSSKGTLKLVVSQKNLKNYQKNLILNSWLLNHKMEKVGPCDQLDLNENYTLNH